MRAYDKITADVVEQMIRESDRVELERWGTPRVGLSIAGIAHALFSGVYDGRRIKSAWDAIERLEKSGRFEIVYPMGKGNTKYWEVVIKLKEPIAIGE